MKFSYRTVHEILETDREEGGGTKLDILSPSLSVDPDKMSYACCGASP